MNRSPKALRATADRIRAEAELEPNPELRMAMETVANAYEHIAAKRETSGNAGRPIGCPRD